MYIGTAFVSQVKKGLRFEAKVFDLKQKVFDLKPKVFNLKPKVFDLKKGPHLKLTVCSLR